MALILGIESTCDETAASLVRDGRVVVSQRVASQIDMHQVYGGVVPEIASRAHIEAILPVLEGCLNDAKIKLQAVDGIAVAHRPGLIGSLVVGVTAAKTLAFALGKPLIGVDHVHAHLYSVLLDNDLEIPFPAVGLVASGGHTSLYLLQSWTDITVIGRTIDDAVGEAYDKVSAIMDLGYPGGPIIDRLAAVGDPFAYDFPQPLTDRDTLDFSFSGLKTAVRYKVLGTPQRRRNSGSRSDAPRRKVIPADVAASFQRSVCGVICTKLIKAANEHGASAILLGGGVSANRGLRAAVRQIVPARPTFVPDLRYCTDNAAMIAGLGDLLLSDNRSVDLTLDAETLVTS